MHATFAELIAKITVSDKTPTGLLEQWQKDYPIGQDCLVIVK